MSSPQELAGKVALVTGGGKNIGRAIAFELAQAGAHVAVIARVDSTSATAVAEELRRFGVEAEAYLADVTDEAAVNKAIAEIGRRFGALDILVNNAALRNEKELERLSLADWHDVLAVTLDGAFLCTREALPWLTASGAGTVVNIGGLSAYTGATHRAHVVTAKAGLGGLTRALAVELAPRGVTVNLVAPGLIDTVRHGEAPHHHATAKTLVGRKGAPNEVASMVRYLASPSARYVTGQTIHVNGGAYLG
jgi:3-oxoacyl-[acyl-carrier protein] reductase